MLLDECILSNYNNRDQKKQRNRIFDLAQIIVYGQAS